MKSSGVIPDYVTSTSFLRSFFDSADLKQADEIHAYILRNEIIIDALLMSTLLDIYLKGKNVDMAQEVFESSRTVEVVKFSAMISGYVLNGLNGDSFCQLVEVQLKPNAVALANVLSACSDLTAIKLGKELQGYIKNTLVGRCFLESAMIDMYAKCGRLYLSYQIFKKMSERNVVAWNSMISSCAQNAQLDEGFAQRIMEYFIKLIMKKHVKDISKDNRVLGKLRRETEHAKRALSNQHQINVEIESLYNGLDFSEPLTRAQSANATVFGVSTESRYENKEGEDIIATLPWHEWWDFELNKDDSNPQITLLRLHPNIRGKFNTAAAWKYARSMSEKYVISFDKLLMVPVKDDRDYSDGKLTSCVAFILEILKHAGLFDLIGSSTQVNEFTIKDAYSRNCSCLGFFYRNSSTACYVVQNQVGSLIKRASTTMIGYIKTLKSSSSTPPSPIPNDKLWANIVPFGAVFIELFFILTSTWLNQFYCIFGFLFIVFVILIVICAEVTLVLCSFQLDSEATWEVSISSFRHIRNSI